YTSGSTGRPKGVAVEHRNVVRLVRKTDYVEIATSDTLLHYAPLGFDASTFEIWGALLNGARLAIPAPGLQTMDELAATIERFGVTTLFLTTALFARFVDLTPAGSSPLRCVLTGGEVASGPHLRRFLESLPDCRLLHVYGPTENTTFSTFHALALADTNADNIPIGRPIANSSAYVLDEELRPLPAGAIGELCVGGDGVARGYLNAPELTAERFVADPFSEDPAARLYRTGDRARFRSDGALEFLGRSDGQVKVRGYRIELGEIETALRAAPGVRDAVAVVLERDGGKDIVAHVAASPGFGLDEGALRAHLARTLPRYTRPHRIIIHEELPLGPNGKLDRVALTRRAAPTGVPTRGTPPRFARDASALARERAVAGIWREVLGCEQDPGRDENFFDLGGDSLRLLTVHARLSERFGVRVCTTDLLEQTTIRKLAAFLEREEVRS
ncbi:MAG TPA: non-ribosomal peptide synthetase, partial [Candidatus Baltobacteraceae bacterium]|nr:non-ribosomal peptide synthetase [Candidatus Baltobacteraceae bacterium]